MSKLEDKLSASVKSESATKADSQSSGATSIASGEDKTVQAEKAAASNSSTPATSTQRKTPATSTQRRTPAKRTPSTRKPAAKKPASQSEASNAKSSTSRKSDTKSKPPGQGQQPLHPRRVWPD